MIRKGDCSGRLSTNILLADQQGNTEDTVEPLIWRKQVHDWKLYHGLFFVIATQNPVETRGTFPLPEAQLDRFFMRLRMGYPDPGEGVKILMRFRDNDPLTELKTVVSTESVIEAQKAVTSVTVSDAAAMYIVEIVEATRHDERIALGVSPRGSLALMKAAQVKAVMEGRDFITPDDVKNVAVPYWPIA